MTKPRKAFLFALLVGLLPLLAQRYDPHKSFTVSQLREDWTLLEKALKDSHAGLNRYVTPDETAALFSRIGKGLNRPMTEREFYAEVTLLSSVINCGHTRIRRSASFYEWREKNDPYLPVRIRILDGRAYVRYDLTKEGELPAGSEILRVNGRAVSALIEKMIPHIPGDGTIRTGRIKTLEDNFPILYRYLVSQDDHYEVELLLADGSDRLVRVAAETLAESGKVGQSRYPELSHERPPALALEIRESAKVAVLTVRSFGGSVKDRDGNDYNAFLDQSFRKIQEQKVADLIVDLRGNGGGSDVYGSRLFSYLTDRTFEYYDHLGMVVERVDFLKHTSLPEDFNDQIDQRVRVDDQGRRLAVGHPNLQTQKPLEPGFRGPVIFLIDRGSFSATAEFASVAHYKKRGVFIGEETAGGYHGNTSGMSYRLTLPNTRLQISIPMIKYVSAVSGNPFSSRGILPDYRVLPTIEDVLSEADPVMDFALERIRLGRDR